MKTSPSIEDLIGIEYSKLGFFREAQEKITQLRASTRELERRRQQIQAILDGITDVMAVISPEGRITSVNHVFYDVFEKVSPVGRICHQVFRDSTSPCGRCPARIALKSNRLCRQEHVLTIAGVPRHFEITASPLRDPHGHPCHVLLLKRDVTVERQYQAKLSHAEKMSAVGLLAAGVAHEINNPLTAILGFAQAILRHLPEARNRVPDDFGVKLEEYMQIILEESTRCREIVQSLLAFSRPHSGSQSPVNLNQCVQETLKLVRYRIKEDPKVRLQQELDESLPPILGAPSELKQLFLNLLLNALDASHESGITVLVRTYVRDDERICLEVQDTGCGMHRESLPKIFDPFFTTKPVGQGTGMGLSMCYSIAQAHNASIEVESKPHKGSTFRVVFGKIP
ncbi:hypothetical protein SAMN02746041_02838 [Desulfacinum hydrothermale DSM 13146]|uniref:histidine kinase n=1 Tax=Desulfacinum hydrothermale DSM 13146 TaxID=1121390 RepID=A0A1W1XSQ4_9BACT|nr:ATP-binding protein [Desulfacinum hydrothermale]SMC27000.1 hypothetical protein SAMN02746041_02838 [Desulfacinum hydrothermale DSM 13146]